MYACKSEQSNEYSEMLVLLDLSKRGWRCLPGGRDYPYDLVIDRGVGRIAEGLQRFETVQVKYIGSGTKLPVCTRRNAHSEQVSINGKTRNNNWYDDHEITYLAAVTDTDDILYYHIDQYRHYDRELCVRSVPSFNFPVTEPQRVASSRIQSHDLAVTLF